MTTGEFIGAIEDTEGCDRGERKEGAMDSHVGFCLLVSLLVRDAICRMDSLQSEVPRRSRFQPKAVPSCFPGPFLTVFDDVNSPFAAIRRITPKNSPKVI